MDSHCTRRYELAMPHFKGLDLGALIAAYQKVAQEDPDGVSIFFGTLVETGKLKTIRTLSALSRATETELKAIEEKPALLKDLEEHAAARPLRESLEDAMLFQRALLDTFGATLGSFAEAPAAQKKDKTKEPKPRRGGSGASPSEG